MILVDNDESSIRDRPAFRDALPARLKPMTRAEVGQYLSGKLRAAGRNDETFTPRAVTRIHAASGGIPRTLDRMASLSMMAAAFRGMEMISAEVVAIRRLKRYRERMATHTHTHTHTQMLRADASRTGNEATRSAPI